jgi:putative transposase
MANPSMDRDVVTWLRQQLQEAQPDLLREMLATMVQELMGAEAQQLCGAEYGERSNDRTNSRNGYREREWTPESARLAWPCPSFGRAVTFRSGCSSRVGERSERW